MSAAPLKALEISGPAANSHLADMRWRHPPVNASHITSAILWMAGSDAVAALVSERLRDLNVTVRQLHAPLETHGRPSDLSPHHPEHESGARAWLSYRSSPQTIPAIWRGGLAPGALRRVKDYVERALDERVDVGYLASMVGLSECHFSRAFRQSTGVPPHRYILARRIEAAAKLIAETNDPLSDIAIKAGFSDQSHFTRTFVRFRGETPGAFRHRHR